MHARDRFRLVVWLRPDQVALARAVVELADLDIVAAGSPNKGVNRGKGGAVAAELGVTALDDLRATLASARAEHDAHALWILDPGDFGSLAEPTDAVAVLEAKSKGLRIATLEPIPASALALSAGNWITAGDEMGASDAVRCVGMARSGRAFREAAETIANLGHVRMVSVESWCAAHESSLGASIFSSLDLILGLVGEPETIDAAYVSPSQGVGVHALPGETLRDLTGDLTANLRFADGRSAAITASDQAGRWNRTVTLLGQHGRLRIYDDGFEWINAQGEKMDESRFRRPSRAAPASATHAVITMADTLRRAIDPALPADSAAGDLPALLGTCQATLLSARTGQPESPGTIRRMLKRD